jgi:hypothetical protein
MFAALTTFAPSIRLLADDLRKLLGRQGSNLVPTFPAAATLFRAVIAERVVVYGRFSAM